MKLVLVIAAGGALGAVGRHFVLAIAGRHLGHAFPWGTLLVNITGSLVMGVMAGVFALYWSPPPEVRALVTVGFLGAFTTFSTFALDVVVLGERGLTVIAALYIALSMVLSVGGLLVGMRIVRMTF